MILLLTKYGGFYYGESVGSVVVMGKPFVVLVNAFFIKRGKRMICYSRVELPRGSVVDHVEVDGSFVFDSLDPCGSYNRAVDYVRSHGLTGGVVSGLRLIAPGGV